MRVLFLDIDGVLNSHEPLCPEAMCGRLHADKVARLNRVLRETDARIVLSSAWRYFVHRGEMSLAGVDWLLRSHGVIGRRLIGVTRPDTMQERNPKWDGSTPWPVCNERGLQITDWKRQATEIGPYAVVDDLDIGISAAGHPFVQTDGKVGLTDADADRLIELLPR